MLKSVTMRVFCSVLVGLIASFGYAGAESLDSEAAKYKPSHGGYPSYTSYIADYNRRILEHKIGQTIVIGFSGVSAEDDGVKEVTELLKNRRIAGVILYARNIKSPQQVKALTDHFKANRLDAMILLDQEGGLVQRFNEKNGFAKRYKKAIESAALKDSEVWSEYESMAHELKVHGITDNLAPVVDLNTNPQSPAIGFYGRSFSKDVDIVTHFSSIFIDAHQKNGVRTYLKHFPGHGSATSDSHHGITDITKTWNKDELLPYENLIKSGHAQAIMTAHVFHTEIDAEFPSTLSKVWIQGYLRRDLGFQGVVITDDLHMQGITLKWTPAKAAYLALRAGCDILLFSNNLKEEPMNSCAVQAFINKTVSHIEAGDHELARRISESYERIMRFKVR